MTSSRLLFALCRKAVENEPLKIYMAMTDLNRYRSTPLEPATVDRLARDYRAVRIAVPDFRGSPDAFGQDDFALSRCFRQR